MFLLCAILRDFSFANLALAPRKFGWWATCSLELPRGALVSGDVTKNLAACQLNSQRIAVFFPSEGTEQQGTCVSFDLTPFELYAYGCTVVDSRR
jgi:hypothetical protein